MKNGIYHSAEGSTWTKKNHKYIRKEGNRYIYPEDLKNANNKSKWAAVVKNERKEKSDQFKKDFSNMWIKPAQNYLKNGNPVAKRKAAAEKAEMTKKRLDTEERLNKRERYFNTKQNLQALDNSKARERVNTALDRNAQRKALIDQAHHRKAVDELHDNRGFKKNQSMYYDDRGVRKTENPKYDTSYDDRGIRKNHNTLTYQIPEKKEDKNFFERKKEEFEKASADRKWEREKKSIKKSNIKELKKRQRNRRIEAGKKVLRDLKNKFSVNKIKEEPERPKEPYIDENGNKVIPMNESYYYDKKAKKMRRIVK